MDEQLTVEKILEVLVLHDVAEGKYALAHEVSPYSITEPTHIMRSLAKSFYSLGLAKGRKEGRREAAGMVKVAVDDAYGKQRTLSMMPTIKECVAFNEGVRLSADTVEAIIPAIRQAALDHIPDATKMVQTADRAAGGECCWTIVDGYYSPSCFIGRYEFKEDVCPVCSRKVHVKES